MRLLGAVSLCPAHMGPDGSFWNALPVAQTGPTRYAPVGETSLTGGDPWPGRDRKGRAFRIWEVA